MEKTHPSIDGTLSFVQERETRQHTYILYRYRQSVCVCVCVLQTRNTGKTNMWVSSEYTVLILKNINVYIFSNKIKFKRMKKDNVAIGYKWN